MMSAIKTAVNKNENNSSWRALSVDDDLQVWFVCVTRSNPGGVFLLSAGC